MTAHDPIKELLDQRFAALERTEASGAAVENVDAEIDHATEQFVVCVVPSRHFHKTIATGNVEDIARLAFRQGCRLGMKLAQKAIKGDA